MTGFLDSRTYHPVRYWRQDHYGKPQNFGDYLSELFLDSLFTVPTYQADAYFLVGSVINDGLIRRALKEMTGQVETGTAAFWGCGVRDARGLTASGRKRAVFFGVRGPLTRDALKLPPNTVLGDPGLLVPLLVPIRPEDRHDRTMCILHVNDPLTLPQAKQEIGADIVTRAWVQSNKESLVAFLRQIGGASFVLTSALHGAIVACAYGVPFAFYSKDYINIPFKWQDFAQSVGLPCVFVKSLAEGQEFYRQEIAPNYKPLPLTPMLANAPLAARQAIMLRAMHHDGLISDQVLRRMTQVMRAVRMDAPQRVARLQQAWMARAQARIAALPVASPADEGTDEHVAESATPAEVS